MTDEKGGFTLRGLVAGRHRLRVSGPGVLTAEVRFVDVPGTAMRVLVSRRAEVRGRVTDGGKPIAGAAVRLLPLGAPSPLTASTDASGAFAFEGLAEGRFRMWAGLGERASPAQAVDRTGPGPFVPLELAMGPAAVVRGRVVDGSTERGVAAHVTLVADDPEEPPRTATSSAAGDFSIDGVPPGRWTADAFAPGYVSADTVRFAAGDGYAPAISLRRGGVLAGRVVDASGAPVPSATVMARGEDGADVSAQTVARRLGEGPAAGGWDPGLALAASGSGLVTASGLRFIPRGELGVLVGPLPYPPAASAAVRVASPTGQGGAAPAAALPVDPALESRFSTDRDGRFRLTGLAPGRYRVLVGHPDFADTASSPRAIDLDQRAEVDIVLVAGLVVHGTVVDERGAAVAGATVEARAGRGGPDPRVAITGRDGRYRLAPVATDVEIEVSSAGHGSAWRAISVGRLGGARATRQEDFALVQADAAIEGRVTDASGFAVAGATVRLARGPRATRPAVTDATGRFRLAGVVGGRHTLRIEHADYPAAELDAAAGAANELRLSFGGGMAVEVRDRSGGAPIAGAAVVARGPGGAEVRGRAARDGRVELAPLAPGAWTVEASAPGYGAGEARAEVAAASRARQITAPSVRVELTRGAILAGVVRDRNGERVAGATVGAGRARTTSDEHGRFRLTDVASGQVTVEAEKDGESGALSLDLAPGDELVTVELRFE